LAALTDQGSEEKEPNMLIIGCDFHSRFQQIAMVDTETGELVKRRLAHSNGDAQKFYAGLQRPVRVGMEATGYAQWFEQLLAQLGHELWVGDVAAIRAAMVRKQKTDDRDCLHILDLLVANRFPRIWIPTPGERDLRQLLRHRHKMVGLRTSVKNQLHALAMGQGVYRKRKLWAAGRRTELEALALDPWASRRRQELLALLDRLDASLTELDRAVAKEAEQRPGGPRLDATTRRGTGNGLNVGVDDRAGGALPTQQTGGELPRAESARK
jgi:transposase